MPTKTIEERALIVEKMPTLQKAHAHLAYEEFVKLGKATKHIRDRHQGADNIRPVLDGFIFRAVNSDETYPLWGFSREGKVWAELYKSEEHAIIAVMAHKARGLNLDPVRAISRILGV